MRGRRYSSKKLLLWRRRVPHPLHLPPRSHQGTSSSRARSTAAVSASRANYVRPDRRRLHLGHSYTPWTDADRRLRELYVGTVDPFTGYTYPGERRRRAVPEAYLTARSNNGTDPWDRDSASAVSGGNGWRYRQTLPSEHPAEGLRPSGSADGDGPRRARTSGMYTKDTRPTNPWEALHRTTVCPHVPTGQH